MLILGVIFGGFNIGMAAFAAAVLLSLLRAADDGDAIKKMPWSTILMVCGVTVLIGLLEKTGGMEIFTNLLSSIATQATVIPFLGFIIGLVSAYSSTSGVVLPAFLPTVPGLIEKLGGGSALVDRVDDEHRGPSRRRVAAVDDRRALHRGRARGRGEPQALQPAARVGAVDDRGRRAALLDPVRLSALMAYL